MLPVDIDDVNGLDYPFFFISYYIVYSIICTIAALWCRLYGSLSKTQRDTELDPEPRTRERERRQLRSIWPWQTTVTLVFLSGKYLESLYFCFVLVWMNPEQLGLQESVEATVRCWGQREAVDSGCEKSTPVERETIWTAATDLATFLPRAENQTARKEIKQREIYFYK